MFIKRRDHWGDVIVSVKADDCANIEELYDSVDCDGTRNGLSWKDRNGVVHRIADLEDLEALQAEVDALEIAVDALEAANLPPAPTYDLGDAEDFVVLSGDDLVDTNPQFFATGDVGYVTTELGDQTFGTGSLKTGVDLGTSVADAAALKAVLIALPGVDITATAAALETTNIGFGAGVFTPDVYTTASAIGVTASGTITLSGDGDYVFISTAGALTFGANTTIILTNGAKASKIFWVAATDLSSTGANSILKGNFLSVDATVASTNTFEGRILASGDVTIDGTATNIFLPLA